MTILQLLVLEYLVIMFDFILFGLLCVTIIQYNQVSSESSEEYKNLLSIQTSFKQYLENQKTESKEACIWDHVTSSINNFKDSALWSKVMKDSGNVVVPNALIHTACLSTHSFGNGLSEYIEARIVSYICFLEIFHYFPFFQ